MPRKQTRRAVSVKGATYWRLSEYAKREKKSRSSVLEKIIHAKLDAAHVPRTSPDDPRIKALKSELPIETTSEPRFELDDEQPANEPEDGEFASGIKLL